MFADEVALERVVVEENQGIQADIKLFGDGAEVGGLIVPIGAEGGDIGSAQHHFGVFFERFERVGFVVLGADGEDDAAAGEILGVFLDGGEAFAEGAALADGDAVHAVIADDAAPERVVEIEHQAFIGAALVGGDQARDEFAVAGREGGGDFLLGAMPEGGIVPGVQPVAGRGGVEGDEIDAVGIGQRSQRLVEAGDEAAAGAGEAVLVAAEQSWKDIQRSLLKDGAGERIARQGPAFLDQIEHILQGGVGVLLGEGGVEALGQVIRVEREQDRGRFERVQCRGGVEQFLQILTVIVLVGGNRDVAAQAGDADSGVQMGQGGGAQDGEADGFGAGGGRRRDAAAELFVQRIGLDKIQACLGEGHGFRPAVLGGADEGQEALPPLGYLWKPSQLLHVNWSLDNARGRSAGAIARAGAFCHGREGKRFFLRLQCRRARPDLGKGGSWGKLGKKSFLVLFFKK